MTKLNVRILLILMLFVSSAVSVYGYSERNILQKSATVSHLKDALVMNQKWVPYPSYTDRGGWDDLLGENKGYLIRQGEAKLDYEWKVVPASAYIEFERSGNRQIMERPFGQNNLAIVDLLLAELAEGKGRFIDQLINGVFQACEMTSWALSAHLPGPQVSKRSLPDNKKHVIDLTSGDLSSLLSWVYYYFKDEFDKINPTIAERLRQELQERTLDTYMNDDSFWWMAFNYTPGMMINNWNPWCNFNVLQTFFLLENDRDKLAEAVYRTMISVDKFINYTHSDGACEEGPSYWGHAAGKMYDYLQMLADGTGGKVSVFAEPIVRNMGEYIVNSYVGNGWVVNFADASAKGGGNASLIYRYGKAVDSNLMMQFAGYLNSKEDKAAVSAGRDIFRIFQSLMYDGDMGEVTPQHKVAPYVWYPETEFCYMSNKNGFFVAAKGGYNNESHNHNDIGTFSLYIDETPVLIDAGVGTYTRQTFSSERYSIWTMQSNYHNVPMINGVPQSFGAKYKAKDAKFNSKAMRFSLNIADAYPEDANVKEWVRSYQLRNNELKIGDKYQLNKADDINQINFLTHGSIDLSTPGEVIIEVDGVKAKLSYNKNIFAAEIETVELDDPRLSGVWGQQVYRLSLNAKQKSAKGNYEYSIKKL